MKTSLLFALLALTSKTKSLPTTTDEVTPQVVGDDNTPYIWMCMDGMLQTCNLFEAKFYQCYNVVRFNGTTSSISTMNHQCSFWANVDCNGDYFLGQGKIEEVPDRFNDSIYSYMCRN